MLLAYTPRLSPSTVYFSECQGCICGMDLCESEAERSVALRVLNHLVHCVVCEWWSAPRPPAQLSIIARWHLTGCTAHSSK